MNEIFKSNLKKWSVISPEAANLLNDYSPQSLRIHKTKKNITLNSSDEDYLSNDPVAEAKTWFTSLDLKNKQCLIIFGIGLGYYYESALDWLKENNNRIIIFIENNLDVIYHYFSLESASQLLTDKQARLIYAKDDYDSEKACEKIASLILNKTYAFSALKFYENKHPDTFQFINSRLSFLTNLKNNLSLEILNCGSRFFYNFYKNLFFLPTSYLGNALYGKFTNIPAIICGAGPSLDKNLKKVETLFDKALIFAGGTALNAVSSNGFSPHFGAGIDPNESHLNRLMINQAFEVPFFYRNRMLFEACQEVHADRLYVTGSGGYAVSAWFESQLNIAGFDVNEGYNVINFTLSLAKALGCNPIILAGVDLAYTRNLSYQQGVINHPLHQRQRHLRTKNDTEELLLAQDIYGQPIHTLWKWVMESNWYTAQTIDSNVLILNSTEGGIGFANILNIPLEEVVNRLLVGNYPLSVKVGGEIENSEMPSEVKFDKIKQLVVEFKKSLETCREICLRLIDKHIQMAQILWSGGDVPDNYKSEKIDKEVEKLNIEVAYIFILKSFEDNIKDILALDLENLKIDELSENGLEAKIVEAKKIMISAKIYSFLQKVIGVNLECIKSALEDESIFDLGSVEENFNSELSFDETGYIFEKGNYTIVDPDLNIHYQAAKGQSEKALEKYSEGQIKVEYYLKGSSLHGPSIFFSKEGQVLAKCWYVDGLKEGKEHHFYRNGALKSLNQFKNNLQVGLQTYYYKNGSVKTKINYSAGILNGNVELYYPNGKLKKIVPFLNGKRHGLEQKWNPEGVKVIEVEYDNNRPVGKALAWHENGVLAQQVTYDEKFQPITFEYWDENGQLIEKTSLKDDYFDQVTRKTQSLTQSLEGLVSELGKILPLVSPDDSGDFAKVKDELTHLKDMNEKLMFESGLDTNNPLESIWKTPLSRELIANQLDEITKKMKDDLDKIQKFLEDTDQNKK